MNKKHLTRRELEALNTKQKLFDAAVHLFSKKGFNNVTVEDITKLAKVSKGSFYTHFDSKENVLVEEFKLIDEQYEKSFENLEPNTSASDQFRLLIKTMSEYVQHTCGVSVIQVVYMNQISPSKKTIILENKNRTFYKLITQIVDIGMQSNEFRNDISRDLQIKYLAREIRGLIYDWCMSDGSFDLVEEGLEYCEYILSKLTSKK